METKYLFRTWFMTMVAIVATFAFTSCGGDENDDEPSVSESIIGTWSATSQDEYGQFATSLTFNKDGKCIVSETWKNHPEESYSVTVSYSVSGDLSKGAILKMWGKTVDGDNYKATYDAKISGKNLVLLCIEGEGEGETLLLTKQ